MLIEGELGSLDQDPAGKGGGAIANLTNKVAASSESKSPMISDNANAVLFMSITFFSVC